MTSTRSFFCVALALLLVLPTSVAGDRPSTIVFPRPMDLLGPPLNQPRAP